MKYGLLIVAVVALGVAGCGTYLLYPRFDLPAVDAVGLAVLSLAAGVAAFFSPCSFPLLATLLIRESEGGRDKVADRRIVLGRALGYATALSLGTTVSLLVVGGIIAAGGQAFLENVTFTSSALMFGLSLAVATAQEVVTRMADVGAGVAKRWGGRILIDVGLWLVVLALGANVFARFFPVRPDARGQMPGMSGAGNRGI